MGPRVKRTKKQPISISSSAIRPSPTVSHKLTQAKIATFHNLLKKRATLKRQLDSSPSATASEAVSSSLQEVELEIAELGGLDGYQKASTLGQAKERGGDSSKVLVDWIKTRGYGKGDIRSVTYPSNDLLILTPQSLLEIGALRPDNYSFHKWIHNTPIDLHSQHPNILEQDFFDRPLPASEYEAFDIVSCSLVLNFVDEPLRRGEMLYAMRRQLKQKDSSLLFLVLPLPCLRNSRYLTIPAFVQLMKVVGFDLVQERYKANGKVGYWLWRWAESVGDASPWRKKAVMLDGPKKNNFAVVLPQ
ncbi:hypothetical protein L198_04312 [Cryptococcus wingfieldii CBS 7118]|uniref:25S rRNA adenine-N(1) methyltransferase n=1 Tax=Cryptococcus wingfieldii CBS 7118 TaxID=1295528 RepID=A0A1E3J4C0_9TREE|nr:hypothetical protein L198_04312 [Cryptococcus wingfieldii CBS 7118]ODN95694.1 hypothetical protein L198_04312 [Cryptococcus wingfieldii CBS 7118]